MSNLATSLTEAFQAPPSMGFSRQEYWSGLPFPSPFIKYGLYYVEVCSFSACFLEGFYHKWMLYFVKGFLCIY